MLISKVIYEDEVNDHVRIKYPCFELRDIVEYYFEITTESNLITPFSIVALPNVNIVASVNLTDKSQTLKVDRKLGIKDTTGDKLCGSLTDAITIIHAPGTHEFAIKFKPGVLYLFLKDDIPCLLDSYKPLSNYIDNIIIEELKSKKTFDERVSYAENYLLSNIDIFKSDYKLETVIKAVYYITHCGDFKSNMVSKKVGVSTPTLNRYFKEVLGMSPKQCFRALRFKIALMNYRSKGSSNSYDELGYTDFSHFAKESQCLTNKKPSEL